MEAQTEAKTKAKPLPKSLNIQFPRKKCKKGDIAWAFHHSEIPGFSFIYEKLVEAAKEFTADTKLLKCFYKSQNPHIKMRYEKQKDLPDEALYGRYERATILANDPGYEHIHMTGYGKNYNTTSFLDKFDITPKKELSTELSPFHMTTPYYDASWKVPYRYKHSRASGSISSKGCMLCCTDHPIARYMAEIYKSIYGNLKYTEVRGLFWYPKGGFREWHTNEHTRLGWRLYLVYADEDEKSWFSFKHPQTGKLHTMPDRSGYINVFKITKDPPVWHNIYSQTNRISLGIHVTDEFIEKFIEFI